VSWLCWLFHQRWHRYYSRYTSGYWRCLRCNKEWE
jgi:hypothetical protein